RIEIAAALGWKAAAHERLELALLIRPRCCLAEVARLGAAPALILTEPIEMAVRLGAYLARHPDLDGDPMLLEVRHLLEHLGREIWTDRFRRWANMGIDVENLEAIPHAAPP